MRWERVSANHSGRVILAISTLRQATVKAAPQHHKPEHTSPVLDMSIRTPTTTTEQATRCTDTASTQVRELLTRITEIVTLSAMDVQVLQATIAFNA